ncbi:hypothetical protein S2091_3856 [Solimicrobium silvestre]|uniref:Uncharacterized protein n=1 Tax=Solimicrobium silvestre TaxID=2099400 RepID=A0A2S9GUQ7_9BURK|nr:hypothetical protein S2091_3856 [Solimicrobium silvestre]
MVVSLVGGNLVSIIGFVCRHTQALTGAHQYGARGKTLVADSNWHKNWKKRVFFF